jgi:dienelactone hydrolase
VHTNSSSQEILIPTNGIELEGRLGLPEAARGLVLFAHGSGSSRFSPRNNYVAQLLREAGLGTLLMDLLTRQEDADYRTRFDIRLLTERLIAATRWAMELPETRDLPIGYFGASTGAAAALEAAAQLGSDAGDKVQAVVSRGGRPDLAREVLPHVLAPTLLIVGGDDTPVVDLNHAAYQRLRAEKELVIVPGATHLFEEPGKLEEVARLATAWFLRHLRQPPKQAA